MPRGNGTPIAGSKSEAVAAIIAAGKFAAARGWVPATSGNFSARVEGGLIAVTRRGRDKGALCEADIATFALDAPIPPGVSAETPLHVSLYRSDAQIGAVFHVHSLGAALLSRLNAGRDGLRLCGWELQKAFAGVASHETALLVPIFANNQDTAALAREVERRLAQKTEDSVRAPGYLLAGHGLYAWGETAADAERHLEAFDALFALELEMMRIGP